MTEASSLRRDLEASYSAYDPVIRRTLGNLVARWIETGNPHYADDAVAYCDANDLPVSTVLRKVLAKAAEKRRNGNATAAMREGVKAEAFRIMANLIIHGASVPQAASKAARLINTSQGFAIRKASSLEKQYEAEWRSGIPSLEDQLRQSYLDEPDTAQSAEWRRLVKELPEAPHRWLGERR